VTVLDRLIKQLSSLPGLGRKSASRIAYHLLRKDPAYASTLGDLLKTLHESVTTCSVCGNYTDQDPCEICRDRGRDRSLVCVVEQPQDVKTIDSTREYNGLFHVLNGVISPIDGIGPENLNLSSLEGRIDKEGIQEVIIATNPTVEGDTTALYISRMVKKKGVSVTRLASGLPVGGDMEYADRTTLARSLKGRIPFTL
jgi:recombination protein RecR